MDKNFFEDDYLIKRDILLRNYQIKLIESAKTQNSIIFLPTGSGKTLIALHVLCSKTEELKKPFAKNGKRAFFIGPTKVIVYQLANIISTHTKFQVGYYIGDMNIDTWSKETWYSEFEQHHVLVLTAEILKRLLSLNFIQPKDISLIVFDECHHAVFNHPYRGIMKSMECIDSTELPLILGLSATLLNSTPKKGRAEKLVQDLEETLRAKVISEIEINDVLKMVANPKEKIVLFNADVLPSLNEVFEIYDNAIKLFDSVIFPSSTSKEEEVYFKKKSKILRIKNCLVSSREYLEELGAFPGSLAALYYIILLEKYRLQSEEDVEMQTIIFAKTELFKVRLSLERIMGGDESDEMICNFSNCKLRKLIDIIKESFRPSTSPVSMIIFVRKRATAIILTFLIKRLQILSDVFQTINAEFVVGTTEINAFSGSIKNEDILERFASRNVNLLIATNILEEGIDVSACNFVISFDFPTGYPSYIQSRGRARDKQSTYYIFCEASDSKKLRILQEYRQMERDIQQSVKKKLGYYQCLDSEEEEEEEEEDIKKTMVTKQGENIFVDGSLAIQCVERYCQKLPQDRFADLSPTIWYKICLNKKQAFLHLPINSPCRDIIQGDFQNNFKSAKKSVCLKTVEILYEMEEVDDQLMPIVKGPKELNLMQLFPHYKSEKIDKNFPQPGTKRRKQIYKSSCARCLADCLPKPGMKTYLHVMNFNIAFDKPELNRKIPLYDLLRNSCTYGILTSKTLKKICSFPVFLDVGQIDCDFLVNYRNFFLTSDELTDIKLCHYALFRKVLNILKNSHIYDQGNQLHSYYVVPLSKNSSGTYDLNWNIILSDFCKSSVSAVVRYNPSQNLKKKTVSRFSSGITNENHCTSLLPMGFTNSSDSKLFSEMNQEGDTSLPNFIVTEEAYKNFVISPNYRPSNPPDLYVVASICHNMSPLSPFPRKEFSDYFEYYNARYDVQITNLEQPLLKVTEMPKCSNFNRPKHGDKNRKLKSKKDEIKQYQEYFIPELCNVYPFHSIFWIKALLVPTVLNRIAHIYGVEELRCAIVEDTGLGLLQLPNTNSWEPLRVEVKKFDKDESEISSQNLPLCLPLSQLKNKSPKEVSLMDVEKNLYNIGLCDIENLISLMSDVENKPSLSEMNPLEGVAEILELSQLHLYKPPKLKVLNCVGSQLGPQLAQLVQACTAKAANDIIDYERQEILGDSFLKFAITLFLFKTYSSFHEGILTNLKGKLVGNRNLLYCGLAKNLVKYINVNDFSPMCDWNPPLFFVHEQLVDELISSNTDPAVVRLFNFSQEEQISGVISESTLTLNKNIIKENRTQADELVSSLINRESISDKIISDVVESLIGVYLLEYGLSGAFQILNWFDILPKTSTYKEIIEKPFQYELLKPDAEHTVMALLGEVFFSDLEETLEYSFRNKGLLLEALTHPSYSRNRITLCYQRLEFLGDAILDFLITSYIYENCGKLSPGEMTDIRSALVNNITFACLAVRYDFHKYLLSLSSKLDKIIHNFVELQIKRKHVVDERILIFLEEENCLIAESVKIPKALGDVFESLAGAIFLDSGNSLETVWNVYYKLMKREIDNFTKTVPKTALRLLNEISSNRPYYEVIPSTEFVLVKCTVVHNDNEITTHGFGSCKSDAKRSAAKLALKKIMEIMN